MGRVLNKEQLSRHFKNVAEDLLSSAKFLPKVINMIDISLSFMKIHLLILKRTNKKKLRNGIIFIIKKK